MNTNRDKYLTEAMGGKLDSGCMLDVTSEEDATLCVIDEHLLSAKDCCFSEAGDTKETCGEWKEFIVGGITDFSTWPGFGKLMSHLDAEFSDQEIADMLYKVALDGCVQNLPSHVANWYYEFLKGREA